MRFQYSSKILRTIALAIVTSVIVVSTAARADEPALSTIDAVTLQGAAFSGASGIVRINQAAGVGNLQSNVAILHLGSVSDARLDAITTQSIDPASKITNLRSHGRIVVSSGALADVHGLTQINQSAGNGNVSSNVFSLTVQK